ncbi:MAG TPA: PAS domain S-box protein [Nocardioides sp.]|nr:PAS domain S-box protein [Nocardioides sp.]
MTTRPTVVIVDDSPELRMLVRSRLEHSGQFDVVGEGGDGGAAILLAHKHAPDVLLLDTSMPTMDGLEALPLILAVAPMTKVVVFTGFEERGLADRARQLGAADFVEKSLPIEQLAERLRQHVPVAVAAGERPQPKVLRVAAGHDEDAARDQAALDEHLERFREVFLQAAIGMATMTLNGSIVRGNEALADMMQCYTDDLVGIDYGVLTRQNGERLDDALATILAGENLASFEHPIPVGDGSGTARVTLAPIRDSKGEPLYVFAQVQDITAEVALRQSEEVFRLLVTAVKDYAIYMLDTEGHVSSWNAGAQRIKGYAAEEIVGQHFRVFYPVEEQAKLHPEHNLELAIRDGAYAEEGWRVRRDGSRFWASVLITAVYDDAGRHRGFAKITRDQSDQRDYEEERRRAIEQQAHLLAVTAHELRTPTAVIEGSLSMLRQHGDQLGVDETARLYEAMSSSARRLQRLVSDLRTASDVHADALALVPEPVSLRGLLTAALERAQAIHPDSRISVDVDRDVEFTVDPGRLGQALDNLLENAVRHGRPPVRLCGEGTGEGVRVTVSDAGPGVQERLTDRLFERFAHAGPTGGTGLGLHIVREIARSHGGEASYLPADEDQPPRFVLELPRQPHAPDL